MRGNYQCPKADIISRNLGRELPGGPGRSVATYRASRPAGGANSKCAARWQLCSRRGSLDTMRSPGPGRSDVTQIFKPRIFLLRQSVLISIRLFCSPFSGFYAIAYAGPSCLDGSRAQHMDLADSSERFCPVCGRVCADKGNSVRDGELPGWKAPKARVQEAGWMGKAVREISRDIDPRLRSPLGY